MRENDSLATSENESSSKVSYSSSGKYEGLWCVTNDSQDLFLTLLTVSINQSFFTIFKQVQGTDQRQKNSRLQH